MNREGSNKGILIALIVLLVGSLGFNIYQYSSSKEAETIYVTRIDSLTTTNQDLGRTLGTTASELDKYKGISAKLDTMVNQAKAEIGEKEREIAELQKRAKTDKGAMASLRKKIAELEALKEQYLEKIDQLLIENQELKTRNTALDSQVASLNTVKGQLEQKVTTGSQLRAEYVKVKTFKRRNNDKYAETAMARKTNKIETCLTVLDNKIAQSGEKTVYLRIVSPDGKVIGNKAAGSESFKTPAGEEVMYTKSTTVDYQNAKKDICLAYEEDERIFAAGKYTIEVYIDGSLVQSTEHTLR